MLNVGLTGGIACGKSTVAQMFVLLGAHLIDFDKLAHEVQEPGKPAWKEIVRYFGKDVLNQDETIDRNKLGNIVFNDQEKLKTLNNIVHPCVFQEWHNRLEKIKAEHFHAVVLSDVPLLFEGNMQDLFDLTILVLITPEEQTCRLIERNNLSKDEAELRIKNQMPIGEKIRLADIVIENKGTTEETKIIVAKVWKELLIREENLRKD